MWQLSKATDYLSELEDLLDQRDQLTRGVANRIQEIRDLIAQAQAEQEYNLTRDYGKR